jgi:hypothetical protein
MLVNHLLRVSVAAMCRVTFPDPQTGDLMLVLEHRATLENSAVRVQAQPFGGALRILDSAGLRAGIGGFVYDSIRSAEEQDLRILIPPDAWETTREFILSQMHSGHSEVIEIDPCRELEEEFDETMGITLRPEHYSYRPTGIHVQDRPIPTTNSRMSGALTVRIYRIFEVEIHEPGVCRAIMESSRRYSEEKLQALAVADAARGGKGRANGVLVMRLDEAINAFGAVSFNGNGDTQPLLVNSFKLDSTSAVLFEKFS